MPMLTVSSTFAPGNANGCFMASRIRSTTALTSLPSFRLVKQDRELVAAIARNGVYRAHA